MIKKNNTLLLGAHMSIAGGFDKAIERGESIGCTTIQIFTKSNRQWSAKPITKQDIEQFKNKLKISNSTGLRTSKVILLIAIFAGLEVKIWLIRNATANIPKNHPK